MSIWIVHKDIKNKQIILGHDGIRLNDNIGPGISSQNTIKTRELKFKNLKMDEISFHISIFDNKYLYDIIEIATKDLVFDSEDFSYKAIKEFLLWDFMSCIVKAFDKYKYNTLKNGRRKFTGDILIIVEGYVFQIYNNFHLEEAFYDGYDKDFFIMGNSIMAGYGILETMKREGYDMSIETMISRVVDVLSDLSIYIGKNCKIHYFGY